MKDTRCKVKLKRERGKVVSVTTTPECLPEVLKYLKKSDEIDIENNEE